MVKCRGCSGGRYFIFLGLAILGVSWALFGIAAGLASSGPGNSHKFAGYEWLPGAVIMFGMVFMMRFPKKATFVEDEVLENHITGRLIFVGVPAVIGFFAGAVMIFFLWFSPPDKTITIAPKGFSIMAYSQTTLPIPTMLLHSQYAQPAAERGIFSSPSPSPSPIPKRIKVPVDPNPLVGGLMMGHLLAMLGASAIFWLYVSDDGEDTRFNAVGML